MPMQFSNSTDFKEFLVNEKCDFPNRYLRQSSYTKTRDDFNVVKLLGVGSFGKVLLVQEKEVETSYYAMKVFLKKYVVDNKQINNLLSEKRILQSLNFMFTVKLVYFFMDNSYLYLVMPFVAGGELYYHFEQKRQFSENHARFYAAQILLGLEYLHNFDIIYRDLKLENILIDEKGYIKLTDFGLSKVVAGRTYTLCGTPEYIAPEIILNKGYGKSVDFWSFGVVIYELCAGYAPFFSHDVYKLFQLITNAQYKVPEHFTKELRRLLDNLIQRDLTRRFGNLKSGFAGIKHHSWFADTNWVTLLNYEVNAPFIPRLSGPGDTEYFDPIFTLENTEYPIDDTDEYKHEFLLF